MKAAIVNLGTIVSGNWREPYVAGDSIVMEQGKIVAVGSASADAVKACDVVIDADGATAIPGLIDSQVHNTFGDYTPRQKTVGFLESYTHGGVTTAISTSEVHVTGRPKDPEGVKALAVGAVITDGVPRFVGRSRNTPATMRRIRVAECRIPQDFSGAAH
jgi:enamidase